MQFPAGRFKIRSFMIGVAILAVVLALPKGMQGLALILSLPCLAVFATGRLLDGRHRRLAAISFWSLAASINILFAAFCALPGILSVGLFVLWLIVILPTLVGFGHAWAVLAASPKGSPQHWYQSAWMWVVILAAMPGLTAWTAWPFRLRFLTARSALERVADQIEAGQPLSFPRFAGPFRLVASKLDPQTGNVALLIDSNPGGPSGFVRHKGVITGPYDCFRPIRGDWWHVSLGGGWCYHEED